MDPNSMMDKAKADYYMRNNKSSGSGGSGGGNKSWIDIVWILAAIAFVVAILKGKM